MEILIKTKISPSRTNKDQRGDLFRPDGKKGKKRIHRMGLFTVLETVEIP